MRLVGCLLVGEVIKGLILEKLAYHLRSTVHKA